MAIRSPCLFMKIHRGLPAVIENRRLSYLAMSWQHGGGFMAALLQGRELAARRVFRRSAPTKRGVFPASPVFAPAEQVKRGSFLKIGS